MRFTALSGRNITLPNIHKYKINWSAKSRSKVQKRVKDFLSKYWNTDQVFEEFRVAGTRLSLDFYNNSKRIAVEVHGEQHTKFVEYFHKHRLSYLEQLKRDDKKWRFCNLNNIKLIEIYSSDIKTGTDEEILAVFEKFGVTF